MRKSSREMDATFAFEVLDKAPYVTVSFTRPDGVFLPADSRNGLLRPTAHTTGVPALRPDGR